MKGCVTMTENYNITDMKKTVAILNAMTGTKYAKLLALWDKVYNNRTETAIADMKALCNQYNIDFKYTEMWFLDMIY